ncbi:hypothetical protein [Chlorobium sp.]|uniref:hypothetical protein n=1 Tax=Chlorobium sp. TaxID=1095 RepID=UPI003C703072
MNARCRSVRGWLRWGPDCGSSAQRERIRRLLPEGVPVIVVHESRKPGEGIFQLDKARLDAKTVATVSVEVWQEIEYRSGGLTDGQLNMPCRINVGDGLLSGALVLEKNDQTKLFT